MLQRYFTEPYRFVRPYRSSFWCRVMKPIAPWYLRRLGVKQWELRGVEHLRASLEQDAGILLTPNHCRWSDGLVMGMLGLHLRRFFYYIVSYHMFKNGRRLAWQFNRLGCYSILREGIDRESLRATIDLLAAAERPLVLYPEGTWFRQNDRVAPLQEGVALIARQAARATERPILIHPVAIKYWLLEDPCLTLRTRLEQMEARLTWSPQTHLDLLPRIEKLGGVLLAIKEIEHFGQPQPGELGERLDRLAAAHVVILEKHYFSKVHEGWLMERIRRLRQHLAPKLVTVAHQPEECREIRRQLDDLLMCEGLLGHAPDYLRERPSLERLTEAVQRLEESISNDVEVPVAPLGVVIEVGPALDVRAFPRRQHAATQEVDPLMSRVAGSIQGMLDEQLAQGPPVAWHCPPAVERLPSSPPARPKTLV